MTSVRSVFRTCAFVFGCVTPLAAQVNSRPLKPAEQAYLDRMAAGFAKLLPPVPAGWTEVERRIYDAGGTVSDWDAPIQADYEVQLVANDIEARKKIVDERQQALVDKNREAFEAATARNQKMMDEFSAKLEEAMKKNDQAAVKRLSEEFEKNMAAGAKAAQPPIAPRPELSDSYARIRVMINPYAAPVMDEKQMPAPSGFVWVGRRAPDAAVDDREGVTRYLLGNWTPDNGGHKLAFTPNKVAVTYGIVVEIEARADRADALFKAMNVAALKAMMP